MKKKIKILILILLLLLILMIVILFNNSAYKAMDKLKDINVEDNMGNGTQIPNDMYKLIKEYKGNLDTEIISKTYYNFANNLLPKYYKECKDLDAKELNKYYKKYKNTIYIELGYESFEDFEAFINYIKKLSGTDLVLDTYGVMGTTIKSSKEYVSVYLTITYKDNDEIIFNTNVLKEKSENKTSITYDTDVRSELIEKEKSEKTKEQEEIQKFQEEEQNLIPKSGKVYTSEE